MCILCTHVLYTCTQTQHAHTHAYSPIRSMPWSQMRCVTFLYCSWRLQSILHAAYTTIFAHATVLITFFFGFLFFYFFRVWQYIIMWFTVKFLRGVPFDLLLYICVVGCRPCSQNLVHSYITCCMNINIAFLILLLIHSGSPLSDDENGKHKCILRFSKRSVKNEM